jgi:hypothetical protein
LHLDYPPPRALGFSAFDFNESAHKINLARIQPLNFRFTKACETADHKHWNNVRRV